jgi:polyisoprenoid-binding protein YceI
MRWLYLLIFATFLGVSSGAQKVYEVKNSKITFNSEAPKELISAETVELKGLVDLNKKAFAFRVGITSFMGFNSPLQREHFNENYMESNIFPEATFTGKIIEDVDLSKDGIYGVRAKGKLKIHGVEKERIIKSLVTVKNGNIEIRSSFTVMLSDHNIRIPRVVSEKLAPEINVTVTADLKRMK